jgi:tetrahydromethanopterin S-methyltransferase subunit F
MQKSIWIFGIIAGIICAVLEYLFFKAVGSSANVMFVSKIAVFTVCLIFGLILAKKLQGGIISTILSGLLISLIRAGVMIIVFLYLYSPSGEFYQPRADEAFVVAAAKVDADELIKPADKEMELDIIKGQIARQYEPVGYSLVTIGGSLVTGLVLSILMAAFIGKNMMYEE